MAKTKLNKSKKVSATKPASAGAKRGRISKAEDAEIAKLLEANAGVAEISLKLGRAPAQIADHVRKFYGQGENLSEEAGEASRYIRELRTRTEWKIMKEHYTPEELSYFEEMFARVKHQFHENIQATEEIQIFAFVDTIIQINRHKKARKSAEDEILRLELEIADYVAEGRELHRDEIMNAGNKLAQQRANSLSRTKEYEALQKKQEEILGKLKATREQRIKNIESSKQSFVGIIRMLQDKKIREKEGRHMALRKLATEQATVELSQPRKYINGEWDQPLLTSDNLSVDLPLPDESSTALESIE
jgi:hypothetical protein